MSDEGDWPGGRGGLFSGFATAMLERSLPAIREWIRQRLGPRATLGAVEVDGTRVRVLDARIPLGASVTLVIDRATLLANPEEMMSGGPPGRLERLQGRVLADIDGVQVWAAPVEARGRDGSGTAWVDADVTIHDARWRDATELLSGTARVVVSPDHWRIDDAVLEGGGETVRLSASRRVGDRKHAPVLAIECDGARAGPLLDTFHALAGRALTTWVPPEAELTGTVDLTAVSAEAKLSLATEESSLDLELAASRAGELREATARGTVAWADLPPTHAWVDAAACAPLQVRARGHGALRALRGSIELDCAEVVSELLAEPAPLTLAAALSDDDAVLTLSLGPAIELRLATAIAADGALRGDGEVTLDPGAVRYEDIRAEGPPITAPLEVSGTRSSPYVVVETGTPTIRLRREQRPPLELERAYLRAVIGGAPTVILRARTGPGAIRVQYAGGRTRIRAERLDADAARGAAGLAFRRDWLAERSAIWPDDAELWAELEGGGSDWGGQVHLETKRSRLSLAPLKLASTAGLDGTRVMGSVDAGEARALAGLVKPAVQGRIELDGRVSGPRSAPFLDASLTSDEIDVEVDARRRLVLRDVRARARLGRTGLELRTLEAGIFGGRLAVERARIGGSERGFEIGELTVTGARRGLGPWLVGGPGLEDLVADVRLLDHAGALRGNVHARTERSSVQGSFVLADGALDGTKLEGTVAAADLAPWVTLEDAPIGVALDLSGPPRTPRATLSADVSKTAVRLGRLVVPVDRAKVRASLASGRLTWSTIQADLLGGRLRSRGVLSRRAGFRGLVADLTVDGVDVGAIELDGEPLAELVSGTLCASVRGSGQGQVGLRGTIELLDPRYGALERTRPILARWGLPVPPLEGDAPARLEVELADGALRVHELVASVRGLRLRGEGGTGDGGVIDGELVLDAKESWLGQSRWLQLPARLVGGLRVPIRIEGDIAEWRARPDLWAAARWAFERLFSGVEPPPALPAHATTSLLGTDALVDRVAANGEDADEALDALLERGLTPEEIAERVERRRQ